MKLERIEKKKEIEKKMPRKKITIFRFYETGNKFGSVFE